MSLAQRLALIESAGHSSSKSYLDHIGILIKSAIQVMPDDLGEPTWGANGMYDFPRKSTIGIEHIGMSRKASDGKL